MLIVICDVCEYEFDFVLVLNNNVGLVILLLDVV